jgi:hypothetical protein
MSGQQNGNKTTPPLARLAKPRQQGINAPIANRRERNEQQKLCVSLCLLCISPCYKNYTEFHRGDTEKHREKTLKKRTTATRTNEKNLCSLFFVLNTKQNINFNFFI